MAAMLVTCPESAHLEHIDFHVDPLGILIRHCSAFDASASCSASCPRTCAARLDRKRAQARAVHVGRVLDVRSCLNER
jgi:hypothetical protein